MAQINRIRVNNVKYNFGTQYYDDFVMRFSGKNTIYDLANGGGKSVLMLLLLQNMIPNCTLDDKQPIEKLFRSGNDNTTIHSLVEWKLDACNIHNGAKYMTTGFCARKGRDTGDEGETGRETANIEYFNYCIFYREFGENDIKNLPLIRNGERITYNGLKNYLRDLEKKDYGVEVKIFDRKGDYQNFISNYGLYESQWEIIRGINKTEGHVRTYFENNYKTTRKVVEDLLIEEIIEKSYNNRIRKDSSQTDDEEMAQTLLDIKDKLIELSKRKSEMGRYDDQIALLEQFAGKLGAFKEIFTGRKEIENQLVEALLICRSKAFSTKEQIESLNKLSETLNSRYDEESRLVALGEIETELVELDKLNALINETKESLELKAAAAGAVKEELLLHENAADYMDYLENKKQYNETRELIQNGNMEESVALRELSRLAAAKALFVARRLQDLESKKEELQNSFKAATKECQDNEKKQEEFFGQVKSLEGIISGIETEIGELNEELDALMKDTQILVADRGWEMVETTNTRIKDSNANIAELQGFIRDNEAVINSYMSNRVVLESSMAKLSEEESYLLHDLEEAKKVSVHLDRIKSVYNAGSLSQLEGVIDDLLEKLNKEKVENQNCLIELENYLSSIKNHKLPEYDNAYNGLYEYLKGRYKDDVISGKDLLEELSGEEAKSLIEKLPETPYIIFVKNNFEEIMGDKVLNTINTRRCIIPVVKYSVIDEPEGIQSEDMIMVCQNMSFLWDEVALLAQEQKVMEDISKYKELIHKNIDKYQMVFEDSIFIKTLKDKPDADGIENRLAKIKDEKNSVSKQKESEILKSEELKGKNEKFSKALEDEKKHLSSLENEKKLYEKIAEKNDRLLSRYALVKDNKNLLAEAKKNYSKALSAYEHVKSQRSRLESDLTELNRRIEETNKDFSDNFKPYFSEGVEPFDGLTEEEVDGKAAALRKTIVGEAGDTSDKEKLLKSYESAMRKCEEAIRYRGMTLEAVKEHYESGRLVTCTMEEMLALKDKITKAREEIKQIENALDAQSAQLNRMEGGIEHARRKYEDKYGEFVREEISNPNGYIVSHRQEMSQIKEQLLGNEKYIKKLENDNKDILFMEKDLERIVRNAGLSVADNAMAEDADWDKLNAEDYEKLQKQFAKLEREEQSLRNRFAEDKQKLIDALNKLEAFELAEEVRGSLVAPTELSMVEDMIKGIADTNDCIALERDRIEKSISDMERIKDSFENRCVQICSNIRTELDRLPKLSRINLDDEVISIITLAIPYIKEDMYKARMGVYINETVAGAETFNNQSDKLKYLKSRLSWKKMFSVIVTDMNSIKLCLYKREHIKDQSRYLKYEEAVGSTGQSQGIYIQFLIAIIHYISSLNAVGKDTSVIGKTIFIDNPFGAAKDVYIWEPIFKLLKTNHVQLVVPARGATPAITKMFDVNYVLGQKMVAKRQQTVVVDYRSQVQTDEMDYGAMEYEQTMLDII